MNAPARDAEWIWPDAALRDFTRHEDPRVRAWALRQLQRLSPGTTREVALPRLDDEDPDVVFHALATYREGELAEADLERLRALARAPGEAFHAVRARAGELLVERGDADAIDAALKSLTQGGDDLQVPWSALLKQVPERFYEALRARVLGLRSARDGAVLVDLLADACTPDDLPWFFAERGDAADLDKRRRHAARLAWVDDLYPGEITTRAWSGVLDALRALDALGWTAPEGTRKAARALLSPDAWKRALSAARSKQWWHVVDEAMTVCGRLSSAALGPVSPWLGLVTQGLRAVGAPGEHDARLAMALAAGAVRRALQGGVSLDEGDLGEAVRWFCTNPLDAWRAHGEALFARWSAQPPGDDARARAAATTRAAFLGEPGWSPHSALQVVARLYDLRPDARTMLASRVAWTELDLMTLALIFDRDPALLREVAPEALRAEDHRLAPPVLRSLLRRPSRAWSALVAESLDALLDAPESEEWARLLVREFADTSLVRPLLDRWIAGDDAALDDAAFVASLAEGAAPPPNDEGVAPFELELVCDRCGEVSIEDVGGVTLHPDPARCRRDGWDGVVLDRVFTCARCGAVDEYTLGPRAACQLARSLQAPPASRDARAVVRRADGAVARRRSQAAAPPEKAPEKPQEKAFDEAPADPPIAAKPGRNDPCYCGSGKKFKKCHGR